MTGINAYSTTAANNVQANTGINWDEGMPPGSVNNSARQNMADTRAAFNDLIWFQYGKGDTPAYTPLYVAATQFKIAGADVSAVYHIGRRVKVTGSGTGTIYGTISAVAFSTDTTVTVTWDSGSLSNEVFTGVYISQIPVTGSPVGNGTVSGLSAQFPNSIGGLTLSAAGSTATFGLAAGAAADSTNTVVMTLASAYTKTTSAWAVGTAAGSLDTGSIANSTWYHVWLIQRIDTGVVDILTSTSATSPTMPTNYTRKRLIGSMKTDGSAQWVAFTQLGDEFLWAVPVNDVANATLPDSSEHLTVMSVPTGIKVQANISVRCTYSSTIDFYLLTSPDQTNSIPGGTLFTMVVTSAAQAGGWSGLLRVDTSGRIRVRGITSSAGTPTGTYYVLTNGFVHPRGRF